MHWQSDGNINQAEMDTRLDVEKFVRMMISTTLCCHPVILPPDGKMPGIALQAAMIRILWPTQRLSRVRGWFGSQTTKLMFGAAHKTLFFKSGRQKSLVERLIMWWCTGSPFTSCQVSTGSWLVIRIDPAPYQSSTMSMRSRRWLAFKPSDAPKSPV
jgi:hypothetical protein